ncbi:type II toxin-antitoxin system RelE/ParE family toxin [Flavobacterium sp. Sd200]|uniref:type II toxin-antitoxin system RelE/ParE family toxin n=1 Tax=Flavobacterium sp. Sd200 TaxID=2692211 RepID=UPI00136F6542|nr:type II toxin-antitoxin system RelE/ParE family toxin [Flavobacterium sp. Sd200]
MKKKGYTLEIKEEARLDIFESYYYYSELNKDLGIRFLKYIESTITDITVNPEHYQIKRSPYREAIVSKFPFVVVYQFTGNAIIVFSVFNTWRNPSKKPL